MWCIASIINLEGLMESSIRLGNASAEISNVWLAWAIFFLGGILTLSAIWLTLTNLDRTVIFYVLIPGTAIGMILMMLGTVGVRVCEELERQARPQRKKDEESLLRYIAMGVSSVTILGAGLGLLLGSVALGLAVGPLIGLAIAMAAWVRAMKVDA
jgi:hypothetical protein